MTFTHQATKYIITDDFQRGYVKHDSGAIVENTTKAFSAYRKMRGISTIDVDEEARYQMWLDEQETYDEFLAGTGRV